MKFKKRSKIFALITAIVLLLYLGIIFIIEAKFDFELKNEIRFQTGTGTNGYFEIRFINDNFFPLTIYDGKIYGIMIDRKSTLFSRMSKQRKSSDNRIDTIYFKGLKNKLVIKPHTSETIMIMGTNNVNLLNCKSIHYDYLKLSTLNIFNAFYDKQIKKNTKKNHIGTISFTTTYQQWSEKSQQEEIKGEGSNDGLSM